jgi:hypothetical protein
MKRSLMSAVLIPVGPIQRKALQVIDQWDFRLEAQKTIEDLRAIGQSPTSEYIDDGVFALRKYHAIALLDPLNGHAVSDTLDPFWHAQILFTEPYTRFCSKVFGQYMHHYPLDHSDQKAVVQVRRQYDYTVNEVVPAVFGETGDVFYPVGIANDRVICNHAKDCLRRPHVRETRFVERHDLLAV